MSVPLTSSLVDARTGQTGTFTRATVSTCDPDGGAAVTDLGSGAHCQDATNGVRVGRAVTNYALNSEAVDSWTASGATVTASHANGPDGNAGADRVQIGATEYVRAGTTGTQCTAHSNIDMSVWMKSNTAECDIYIGNAYGSGFPETDRKSVV